MPDLYFTMEDASERAPDPSHRQGSQHRCREPLCARKRTFSCDFNHPGITRTKRWKQPCQCKMQAWITKHTSSAAEIFQRSPPRSADNGDHSLPARAQTALVAQTRFPSTPAATLCKNIQGFVRFLASKPHLRKPWTQPFQRKVRFLTSKHHPSKRWKQPFQCKMPAWITKHNGTAHAIFQRSPLRGADNWNRPSAA